MPALDTSAMHRSAVLVALLTLAACGRGGTTTTVVVRRDEVVGLKDSVSGPAPVGIARQLVRDSTRAASAPLGTIGPATRMGPDANAALEEATRTMCAESLRDPASGTRYVARRTQVSTTTQHPEAGKTVHSVRGWGDFEPVDGATSGLPAGARLRVDCATSVVAGIAPAVVTGS